jgi:hypothetical protein
MNYATFQRFIVALPEALAAVCRVHASRYDIVSINTIESV